MSFKKIAAYKDRNKKTPLPYSGTKVLFMYSHGLNSSIWASPNTWTEVTLTVSDFCFFSAWRSFLSGRCRLRMDEDTQVNLHE